MATKAQRIAQLLLKNHWYEDGFWPGLTKGKLVSLKNANKFFLSCIIDYQQRPNEPWNNARRFAEDILSDPDNLWHHITSVSLSKWQSKRREYGLTAFQKPMRESGALAKTLSLIMGGTPEKFGWANHPTLFFIVSIR